MASRDPARPNIVLVLSDDQGPWAMGCAGNEEIITPNLDRLAANGMRFENAFCVSPVCSPARASLLTGEIPSQHGVHDWIKEGNAGASAVDYLAGHKAYTDVLAKHGYVCGISGKWHLGDSYRPQKGFSHWYVHESGGGPYYGAPMIRDGQKTIEQQYVTDAITDDALASLTQQAGEEQPFYLSVHYTAPHSPWIGNHPADIIDLYRDCDFISVPRLPLHPHARAFLDAHANPRESLQGYFAAVTAMDSGVGRILDLLNESDLSRSTLFLFCSDNGFSCGHHGFWGKGNGTFPLNMYDTSVKVPFLACQPGRIPANRVCRELISGYDLAPTLLEYVNLPWEPEKELPGRSFSSLLNDGSKPGQEQVVIFDEYGPVRMVRTSEWKYVHRYPYGPHELYHLAEDPEEERDLAGDFGYKPVLLEMRDRLTEWFMNYVDPRLDGVRQPVTGDGQVNMVQKAGVDHFSGQPRK